MKVLDDYLSAVGQLLPGNQRADILKELSANLRSMLEDKEQEIGRPLREDEIEASLMTHGSPVSVASEYSQDKRTVSFGREFIGSLLFPLYLKVLLINFGIAITVLTGYTIAMSLGGKPALIEATNSLVLMPIIQFAIITMIFSFMQSHLRRNPNYWTKRHRSHEDKSSRRDVSRVGAVATIVASALFASWLQAIAMSSSVDDGLREAGLALAPIWGHVYLPLMTLCAVSIAQGLINFARPDLVWLRDIVRAAGGVVWVVILACFTFSNWVRPVVGHGEFSDKARVGIANLQSWTFYTMLISTCVVAGFVVFDLKKLFQHLRLKSEEPKVGSAVLALTVFSLMLPTPVFARGESLNVADLPILKSRDAIKTSVRSPRSTILTESGIETRFRSFNPMGMQSFDRSPRLSPNFGHSNL